MTNDPQQSSTPGTKFLLEFGPLLAFFGMNYAKGIIWATGTLMVAMLVAMAVSWKRERKIPPMMLITSLTVLFFGGLTIWFDDPLFIKIKVTLVNLAFAGILFGGVLKGRYFVQLLLGPALQLTEEGWRGLSMRFAGLFLFMGLLNELVWRNVAEDTWVTFKVFGLMALMMVFMISQMGYIQRVSIPQESDTDGEPGASE